MFKKVYGNWTDFRALEPAPVEIDYHSREGVSDGLAYHERMEAAYTGALKVLIKAQKNGDPWVMFIHGHSTSRPGATTLRTQIRKLMRAADATPYIVRKHCFQHHTVFVAVIRQKSPAGTDCADTAATARRA